MSTHRPAGRLEAAEPASASGAEPVAIDGLLEQLGFAGDEARAQARAVLEAGGLTNRTKVNIAARKVAEATRLIEARIARCCGSASCLAALDARGRVRVSVAREACEVCRGSDSRRSLAAMVAALDRAGHRRLLVVGGSPATRADLTGRLAESPIEVRFVQGDRPTGTKQAASLIAWADVMVVWANTELSHKVSIPFSAPEHSAKRVTVARRGISALADAVREHTLRAAA